MSLPRPAAKRQRSDRGPAIAAERLRIKCNVAPDSRNLPETLAALNGIARKGGNRGTAQVKLIVASSARASTGLINSLGVVS